MKKTFIMTFIVFLFWGANVDFANAEKIDTVDLNDVIQNISPELSEYPYSKVLDNGEILFFQSKEDYESYSPPSNYQTFSTGGYITKPEVISTKNASKLWIGYHSGTPEWRKVSSHVLTTNKTYSVNGSYKYKEFTLSTGFTHSVSVSSTFPADARRYSKLGVRGDFTFQHIKSTEYHYGTPTGRVTYYAKAIRKDEYIDTAYQ
ncbi:conserved hypothetical protein [Exiguobacterium sp. 8H]|uniref:hypothetical protein n=1 Tax=Exiguobacterium TaxID=33986 RepID=UPI00093E20F1|nr:MULTISPECIES: hypothetical protein [Exiguobacterium]VXB88329.1 conserved hypothetical protein [Exiguobacterium sp. 8H]VXC07856.1 conserved hypothetical protein [Exiguobacterium sp. 8A]